MNKSNIPTQAVITPCAGRCSTVFGDTVCRGCRRFSAEVIQWNTYNDATKAGIWQRLNNQLAQVILPLITVENALLWQQFKQQQILKNYVAKPLPYSISKQNEARLRYEAFLLIKRTPHLLAMSGLSLQGQKIHALWQHIERKLYTLAIANYELTWLRAAQINSDENDISY